MANRNSCVGAFSRPGSLAGPIEAPVGPRPPSQKRWAEIEREPRQVRFHQLLQGSFGFRLLLAFVLEAGKRRQRDNIEAFEVILTCQQACAKPPWSCSPPQGSSSTAST